MIKLKNDFENSNDEVFIKKFVNISYSNMIISLRYFQDDDDLRDIIEHVFIIKSKEQICNLDNLLKLIEIYLSNFKVNSYLVNFICVNAMENLRLGITKKEFETKMLLLFGFICENCYLIKEKNDSIFEFLEEFKSILFHKKFLKSDIQIDEEYSNTHYFDNISTEAFNSIRKFYSNISNKIYMDESFLNYLYNYLHLTNNLNTLNLNI